MMRVYGALMWSLGKVSLSPEVWRVYVGSFWNDSPPNPEFAAFIQQEQDALLRDIHGLLFVFRCFGHKKNNTKNIHTHICTKPTNTSAHRYVVLAQGCRRKVLFAK